jgi:thiol:disulfide interchange protein
MPFFLGKCQGCELLMVDSTPECAVLDAMKPDTAGRLRMGRAGRSDFSLPWPFLAGGLALLLGIAYYATSASHPAEQAFWVRDYPAAIERASAENKLVFMDVYAEWCGPCRRMATDTFGDARVQAMLQEFIPLQIDADRDKTIAAQYGVEFLPSLFVLDASGRVVAQATGYHEPDDLIRFLEGARESE